MIEFFIYTVEPEPVDVATLVQTLQEAGWVTHILRGWLSGHGAELVTQGRLQNNDSTIGFRNSNPAGADIQCAVAEGNFPKLRQWVSAGRLGYAMWLNRPFTFAQHSEFESLDDAREQMGDDYADCLAKATRQYVVTDCNEPEFGAAAMGAVAFLGKGLVEDPQIALSIPAPLVVSDITEFLRRWPA